MSDTQTDDDRTATKLTRANPGPFAPDTDPDALNWAIHARASTCTAPDCDRGDSLERVADPTDPPAVFCPYHLKHHLGVTT